MKTDTLKHIQWTKNCPSVKKGQGKPKNGKKKSCTIKLIEEWLDM